MALPPIEIPSLDGPTLLLVLAGIKGPGNLRIVVNVPSQNGSGPSTINIYTSTSALKNVLPVIGGLRNNEYFKSPNFELLISEPGSQTTAKVMEMEEIKAPELLENWESLTDLQRQSHLMRHIRNRFKNITEMSDVVLVQAPQLTNSIGGKKKMGPSLLEKLIAGVPLSAQLQGLLRDTCPRRQRGPNK